MSLSKAWVSRFVTGVSLCRQSWLKVVCVLELSLQASSYFLEFTLAPDPTPLVL